MCSVLLLIVCNRCMESGHQLSSSFLSISLSSPPDRSECSSGVRLIGGATDTEGVVQVCLNGTYVQVCTAEWNIAEASVVCRQLGRSGDGKFLLGSSCILQ